jgi:hypothetical protein
MNNSKYISRIKAALSSPAEETISDMTGTEKAGQSAGHKQAPPSDGVISFGVAQAGPGLEVRRFRAPEVHRCLSRP